MELDKFIIRRTALGQDRWNRRYWWGLAGVRGAVVAEELAQPSGPSTVSIIKDHVRVAIRSLHVGSGLALGSIQVLEQHHLLHLTCSCLITFARMSEAE